MASSTTSIPATSEDYDEKKKEVQSQIQFTGKAVDLYILAGLLARWRSNDSLPVCLLCQKYVAKKPFGLGHLIPHSILKQGKQEYFADVTQGKESGVSNMGYRAFCSECEGIFSSMGEVHLNPKFFKPFYENQDDGIEVDVRDEKKLPWLYFSLISIVWRCLCFIPRAKDFLNTLEYLRSFLLEYPKHDKDIDSKVNLFVFAPNSELESKLEGDNITFKRFFDGMYTARFSYVNPNMAAWVFMGPIHILMIYNSTDAGNLQGMLSNEDLEQAKACIIRSTDTKISIAKKQEKRFFPMEMYDQIVIWGLDIMSKTVRIHIKQDVIDPALPPVPTTHLFLLPKSFDYADGEFTIPEQYKVKRTFDFPQDSLQIVGACRGKDEKIVFVVIYKAVQYTQGDELNHGPLAMALKVDLDVNNKIKVSYLSGVEIPSKERCCGHDLNEIPYKEYIEKLIDTLIKRDIAKW